LGDENYTEFFKRNEEEPVVFKSNSSSSLQNEIIKTIEKYKTEGFSSIAIICKNRKVASDLYFKLSNKINIKLIDYLDYDSVLEGTLILPVYLAKGLEFDAVIVYQANDKSYNSEFDKKLLYIACTRALHRLSLFYTGKLTKFLK
jgi:DNA helicase-2/ATP-dependent DNA helicase PcrA